MSATVVLMTLAAGDDYLLAPGKRLRGKQYKEAAEATQRRVRPRTEGLVCEVFIPRSPKDLPPRDPEWKSSFDVDQLKETVKALDDNDDEDADGPSHKPSTKRLRTKRRSSPILISDDEAGDKTSDYEATEDAADSSELSELGEINEDDGDESMDEGDDSEPAVPKKKAPKPKAPPKKNPTATKPTKKRSADTSDGSAEPAGKKRKVDKPTKIKKLPHEIDPWKLRGNAQKDWKQMQCPALEMFEFSRVVIDEYTYLDGKSYALITKLQAMHRWVLSGTPPTHDFGSVKTIAAFLDIHLGIDDDGEGRSEQVKKRKREQTGKRIVLRVAVHSTPNPLTVASRRKVPLLPRGS